MASQKIEEVISFVFVKNRISSHLVSVILTSLHSESTSSHWIWPSSIQFLSNWNVHATLTPFHYKRSGSKRNSQIFVLNWPIRSLKHQNHAVNNDVKRYECEISNYAWDQSDKFVKFFISIDGVQDATEENVVVTFTPNSIQLKVINVRNKDHKFEVKNLLHEIDVENSYRKIKTNSVAIYAKKAAEGDWISKKQIPNFVRISSP